MTILSWKTSSIDLNIPPKVLAGTVDEVTPLEKWEYPNAVDDPYWSLGTNPKSYRWQCKFTVEPRYHGSNLTRNSNSYDANDIDVGDFVAGAADSKACQIVKILSKTESSLTAIVEDRLRYNTFKDPDGNGLFASPGPVVFFQINELGIPILDPVPGSASADFAQTVTSRFQYLNPLTNYLLEKTNNGFKPGDAICIENGEFVLSDPNNVAKFIGTVLHSGPGPDQFILRPFNGVIDFVPNLSGDVGDFIYPSIDSTGNLTTNSESDLPIFLKIANSIPSETIGPIVNPTGNDGDTVEINKVQINLAGDGSTGIFDLDQAIALINYETPSHKVIASKVGPAVLTKSDIATVGSAYGAIIGYIPFSASINGIKVDFVTTNSGAINWGDSAISDINDIISDINAAKIPNIVASLSDLAELVLTNTIGGEINIVNIGQDLLGKDFAGPNSISSLPLNTPANTTDYCLMLTRDDGGPITIKDISGQFFFNTGILSGQTGRYALGLMIERGLATKGKGGAGNVTVTSNIETIVPGSTISIGVDYTNTEYPGGLFTVFQQLPITVNVAAIWATLDSNIKDAYLDFTSNTINSKDVGFSINLTNATFNINSTDDITIGSTIVSGDDLTGLNIVANGEYIISSSLLGFTDETDSNVSVTANLTTDRGSIYIGNVYLNNIQPTPFAVASISANWAFRSVPFWDTNQIFNWSVQTIGTALAGTVTYSGGGGFAGILTDNGEISGSSPGLDSTQSYVVQTTDYTGEGRNGAGVSSISDTVSTSLSPVTRYYPLFYKTTDNSNNPNFTTTDQFIRSQYALGQGANTTANTTKYLWIAIPGTTTHKFAYTIFQTEATVTPDMSYLNQSIAGQSYNVYGFTRASLVTKIYTTS